MVIFHFFTNQLALNVLKMVFIGTDTLHSNRAGVNTSEMPKPNEYMER